jgi:hypothetical protein
MMIVNVARGARALARVSRFAARRSRERAGGEIRRTEGIFISNVAEPRKGVNCGDSPLADT